MLNNLTDTHCMLPTLLSFLISMVCGFVATPQILNFCQRHNLYDMPNRRKMHHTKVPRLGGIAFFPSMLLATIISIFTFSSVWTTHTITIHIGTILFLIGLTVIYILGLVDDLAELNARLKFCVQIIAACILAICYLRFNDFYGLMGIHSIPTGIGIFLTVFFIVYTINAFNLIDGIDGLSASLSFIALGGFLYFFYAQGMHSYMSLIAGMMGVLIPYLYFNLFGKAEKNRKIFMGDSGSMTLGFLLGTLTVKFSMNDPALRILSDNDLLLAMSFVLVPILDVTRVIAVRLVHREHIFHPDKNHIHHKLLRTGISQHAALGIIVGLQVFYVILNAALVNVVNGIILVGINIAIYIAFNEVVDMYIHKNGKNCYVI